MKWSQILHPAAAISAAIGLLALIGAWIARVNGTVFSMNEAHLFNDAQTLLLASVAFGIGALIHLKKEGR